MAQFFLEQAGYEVYLPKIRQRCHRKGRQIEVLSPLFPGHLFTRIELQSRGVRLCPGVIKLVMNGDEPSHVPDEVIAEIRNRERNGAIELPKSKLKAGEPGEDRLGFVGRPTRALWRGGVAQAHQGALAAPRRRA